jgi:hypothetical protein
VTLAEVWVTKSHVCRQLSRICTSVIVRVRMRMRYDGRVCLATAEPFARRRAASVLRSTLNSGNRVVCSTVHTFAWLGKGLSCVFLDDSNLMNMQSPLFEEQYDDWVGNVTRLNGRVRESLYVSRTVSSRTGEVGSCFGKWLV